MPVGLPEAGMIPSACLVRWIQYGSFSCRLELFSVVVESPFLSCTEYITVQTTTGQVQYLLRLLVVLYHLMLPIVYLRCFHYFLSRPRSSARGGLSSSAADRSRSDTGSDIKDVSSVPVNLHLGNFQWSGVR